MFDFCIFCISTVALSKNWLAIISKNDNDFSNFVYDAFLVNEKFEKYALINQFFCVNLSLSLE